MRASRTIRIVPFPRPFAPAPSGAEALTVLREVVAQLSERVELLETRERMSRAASALPSRSILPNPVGAPLYARSRDPEAGTFLAGTARGRE